MVQTRTLVQTLRVRLPVVQGPFGGGLSSVALVKVVSEAGGLGSFGFQGFLPETIASVLAQLRAATERPFAVNLWVSTEDAAPGTVTGEQYEAALAPLRHHFEQLGVAPPTLAEMRWPRLDEQVEEVFRTPPPVLSFVFGVPPASVVERCRSLGIKTIGTATTVEEAIAVERAGLDAVAASGFEAGGHRGAFLDSAENSLLGMFSLLPQVVDSVRIPVIAAGGIADRRGVRAAMALGASGVQVGTAFLACEESGAPGPHREALLASGAGGGAGVGAGDGKAESPRKRTVLTRGFTGRLARGFPGVFTAEASAPGKHLPYPMQLRLVGALRQAALAQGRTDLISLWAGQSAGLLRHRSAAEVFEELRQGLV